MNTLKKWFLYLHFSFIWKMFICTYLSLGSTFHCKKGQFCKIVGTVNKENEILILRIIALTSANELNTHILEVCHRRLKLKKNEEKRVN